MMIINVVLRCVRAHSSTERSGFSALCSEKVGVTIMGGGGDTNLGHFFLTLGHFFDYHAPGSRR